MSNEKKEEEKKEPVNNPKQHWGGTLTLKGIIPHKEKK